MDTTPKNNASKKKPFEMPHPYIWFSGEPVFLKENAAVFDIPTHLNIRINIYAFF